VIEFTSFRPWGHATRPASPGELISALRSETQRRIASFDVLPDGPIDCNDRSGFSRVCVLIPLDAELFDQLMNGKSGYRAHYAAGAECGEAFNRSLIESVAPFIIEGEHLYFDKFTRAYCESSLLGRFSKLWYPKSISDKSAEPALLRFKEELQAPAWQDYWRSRPPPRKGLLAPTLDEPAVLLNGTFVNSIGDDFDQKPGRSRELHLQGWT
jgi:hypothetical protein